jgi:predicted  nucleic acid-binding Zn-ribbon protein
VRDTLLALYQLQQIDTKAFEIERSAQALPKKIQELEAELDVERVQLGVLRNELESKKTEQLTMDVTIKDEGAKAQKWKRRLNEIKTPREYQALSREVEGTERQIRDLEERGVGILQEIETKTAALGDREAVFRQKESEMLAKVRELRDRVALLNKEALEAKAGRPLAAAKLPQKTLALYDKVREKRQGLAVAVVKEGKCLGCNVALRPQLYVTVRKLESLEQCPSCSRLLVLDAVVFGAEGGEEKAS